MNKPISHIFLIIILGFLVYSNTFNVPFHFDDVGNIVGNYKFQRIQNFWPPSGSRWLGYLTFALNYHFGGLNVTGYHIVNIAIHILNAILVYWLVILTFKTPYFSASNPPSPPFSKGGMGGFALFSALLFVAHPIQTQAVTYIVQRFTSLATFFYLLSLVMYIKARLLSQGVGVRGQGVGTAKNYTLLPTRYSLLPTRYTLYAVSLISAILAMKTKEISFTLPVIIALYEFMFFEGKIKRRILLLMPILLTMLIIPLSLIETDKPLGDAIGELREAAQETEKIPRWSYLLTQFRVIVTYIRLLVLPINQNLDYDYPIFHSFFNPEVFLSFLFLLLIFALGVYLLYSTRYTLHPTRYSLPATRFLSFGIFWFFITLSVESSIIPIRDVIFEHRVYLPVIGIIIVFVSATFYILQAMIQNPNRSLATYYLLLATAVIVLSIATYERNIIWQDGLSLWGDVAKKSPEKARSYNVLGISYAKQKQFEKAIQQFQTALKLKPAYHTYYNMGLTYVEQEQPDNAIQAFQAALNLQPNYAEAYNDIGIAYNKKGMIDNAIQAFRAALKLKLDFPKAHNNIGIAYVKKGLIYNAIDHYKISLKLDPNNATTHLNLGIAYHRIGDINNARKELDTALQIDPSHYEALRFFDYIYKTHNE